MDTRLETQFEDAGDSTGLILWRMTNSWQAAQRQALRQFDLTHVQFVLLAHLAYFAGDEPVTQNRLAELAQTDRMMTSQVLRTLESKGLVERRPHPTDSRARSLHITEDGRALANRANSVVEGVDENFFSTLGAKKLEFTRMLQALMDSARA